MTEAGRLGKLHGWSHGSRTRLEPPRHSGNRISKRIKRKKDSVKQCLTVCAQNFKEAERARADIFENVSTAKDAQQIVLAMNGALVLVKRVTAGERSIQYLREMF
jgi:hypothetical protein